LSTERNQLAAELGDLPLAAAQAAGYLEQTDLPAIDYLRRFRTRRADLLARGDIIGYSGRVDTTWALSLDRLRYEDPAAVQLLQLAAFLAPEPIPLFLFGDHADVLDEPLRSTAADPDGLADCFETWLVNAHDVKHLPGRPKTDRLDAVWLGTVAERQMLPPQLRAAAGDPGPGRAVTLTAGRRARRAGSRCRPRGRRLAPYGA
jgi:hypothetical protein